MPIRHPSEDAEWAIDHMSLKLRRKVRVRNKDWGAICMWVAFKLSAWVS